MVHNKECLKNGLISISTSLVLLFLSAILQPNQLSAQCNLACNDMIVITIPTNGSHELLPTDIGEGLSQGCPGGDLSTQILVNGQYLPASGNIVLDETHIGQQLTARLTDAISGNSCWGFVQVEAESPLNDTINVELCALLWKDAKPVKGSTLIFQPNNPSFPYAPIEIALDTNQYCTSLEIIGSEYLPGTTFSISAIGPDLGTSNGLGLSDLCGMTRYILGIEPFSTPYAVFAGDVNNSASNTSFDIVLIRRVIMGIDDNFMNSPDWKSFPEGCVFLNPGIPSTPGPCISSLTLSELQALDGDTIRTILVKSGDVDGDVRLPGVPDNNPVLADTFLFNLPQGQLNLGSTFSVPVKAGRDLEFSGFQASIAIDTDMVEFEVVEDGVLDMSNNGTYYWDETNGQLQILVSPINAAFMLEEDDILFYIRIKALQLIDFEDVISLNVLGLNPQALGSDCSTIYPIGATYAQLVATQAPVLAGAKLTAPSPNPFAEQTVMQLDLEQAGTALLEVLDLHGRVLFSETKDLPQGKTSWEIPATAMPKGSMAIWRLSMGGQMTAGKLLRQ